AWLNSPLTASLARAWSRRNASQASVEGRAPARPMPMRAGVLACKSASAWAPLPPASGLVVQRVMACLLDSKHRLGYTMAAQFCAFGRESAAHEFFLRSRR